MIKYLLQHTEMFKRKYRVHLLLKKTYLFITYNQKTNSPVNAHLISGPGISTKHTKSLMEIDMPVPAKKTI